MMLARHVAELISLARDTSEHVKLLKFVLELGDESLISEISESARELSERGKRALIQFLVLSLDVGLPPRVSAVCLTRLVREGGVERDVLVSYSRDILLFLSRSLHNISSGSTRRAIMSRFSALWSEISRKPPRASVLLLQSCNEVLRPILIRCMTSHATPLSALPSDVSLLISTLSKLRAVARTDEINTVASAVLEATSVARGVLSFRIAAGPMQCLLRFLMEIERGEDALRRIVNSSPSDRVARYLYYLTLSECLWFLLRSKNTTLDALADVLDALSGLPFPSDLDQELLKMIPAFSAAIATLIVCGQRDVARELCRRLSSRREAREVLPQVQALVRQLSVPELSDAIAALIYGRKRYALL